MDAYLCDIDPLLLLRNQHSDIKVFDLKDLNAKNDNDTFLSKLCRSDNILINGKIDWLILKIPINALYPNKEHKVPMEDILNKFKNCVLDVNIFDKQSNVVN